MVRRERTVEDKVFVKPKEVRDFIGYYLDDKIFVNRRYQRKLVWSLKEQQLLIDSLLNGYPTPLIMLLYTKVGQDTEAHYEIIDGLQRINAIVCFMLNKYSVEYNGEQCYFDLMSLNETFLLLQEGKLTQKTPVLPKEVCKKFTLRELPCIITEQDDDTIEKIFTRLNSSGRKLSLQDLRQANYVGSFSNLVRRISSAIRGDKYYSDVLNLVTMQEISINSYGLEYGLKHENIFWIKHNILDQNRLFSSQDEECIAYVLGAFILGDNLDGGKIKLDSIYNPQSDLGKLAEEKIEQHGETVLETLFIKAYETMRDLFDGTIIGDFLFSKKKFQNKLQCFEIVYFSFCYLTASGRTIQNKSGMLQELKNLNEGILAPVVEGDTDLWKYAKRLSCLLEPYMEDTCISNSMKLRMLLQDNLLETTSVEYKIGIYKFDHSGIEESCIDKIVKSLVAIANTESTGYVIIGVADNSTVVPDWEKAYNRKLELSNSHYLAGIDAELDCNNLTLEHYKVALSNAISQRSFSENLKQFVLENIYPVSIEKKTFMVIKTEKMNETCVYDGVAYKRALVQGVISNVAIESPQSVNGMNCF